MEMMAESTVTPVGEKHRNLTTTALLILPLVVLAGVILLFLKTGGGLNMAPPVPIETLTVERTLLQPGRIEIALRNTSPKNLTISQVIVNGAVWPYTNSYGTTIPRLGKATVRLIIHGLMVKLTLSACSRTTRFPLISKFRLLLKHRCRMPKHF
jgi:hypothetical protein